MQTGHVLEFGSSPKEVAQEQNIFVFVLTWQCTSRPMVGMYSSRGICEYRKRFLEKVKERQGGLYSEDRELLFLRPQVAEGF